VDVNTTGVDFIGDVGNPSTLIYPDPVNISNPLV
jgi:hypothetical protein